MGMALGWQSPLGGKSRRTPTLCRLLLVLAGVAGVMGVRKGR